MERMIQADITGELVRKDSKNVGVQGEANVTTLRLRFDESWRGYGKRVVWRNAMGENPVAVTLFQGQGGEESLVYNTPIPKEPLEEPGWCSFTVEGYTETEGVRSVALSVKEYLEVKESGGYYRPAEPTPTMAQQILDALGKAELVVQASAQEAKSWAVGGTGSREGEDTDNARYYAEQAGKAAEETAAEVRTEFEALAADAEGSVDAAKAAKASAEQAQGKAEAAQAGAEQARAGVEAERMAAEAARVGAEAAANSAEKTLKGAMMETVYDTQGRGTDVFLYVDGLVGDVAGALETLLNGVGGEDNA